MMTKKPIPDRLDEFCRRHSNLMLAALVVLTIVTTIVLLSLRQAPAVLYEAF